MEPKRIPRHIAFIMDGNGRWAEKRGLPRVQGHHEGVKRVEEIMEKAPDLGVRYLTFYAFSKENWQRPKTEIRVLMELLSAYLDAKLKKFQENDIAFNAIGNLEDLPEKILKKIRHMMAETRGNSRLTATFALSYSARLEIVRACQEIARKAAAHEILPEAVTEKTVQDHLYTAGLPDPDLLIRTSGEERISNFLLWQISYTELYITRTFWPDFTTEEFLKAIEDYQKRERRFGRTKAAEAGAS